MTTKEKMIIALGACLDSNGRFSNNLTKQELAKKYNNYLGFKDEESGAEGYLFTTKDNTFVVVFAGSNEEEDWKTNFTYKLQVIPYDNYKSSIRVHGGYINAYKKVRGIIHDAYKNQKGVIVTGYSMGGALAVLCAVDIQYNFNPSELFVFPGGAPKVFNKPGADSYNRRVPNTFRFVYGNDIVPMLPPFCNWHHVGKEILIGPKRGILPISFKDHVAIEKIKTEIENINI